VTSAASGSRPGISASSPWTNCSRGPSPTGAKPRPAGALEYFATLAADGPHGAEFRYRSILIDVLAWVLEKAGQARFADLVTELLWQPMGAEFDADITGANGRQVIAASWLDDTVRGAPDGPAAFSGGDGAAGYPEGAHYRNGWWVTEPALPALPAFTATGINGQSVFVHGPSQTVVVKLSSSPTALSAPLRRATVAAVTAIAQALAAGA
jgi:CubicO group peptidase (beta-lactamase class C family)